MITFDSRRRRTALCLTECALMILLVCTAASAAPADYNYYFGNLHSHTSYSDGVLTPTDAFMHARDGARLDFHAVTDHGYYMQEATNLHLWYKALEEADAIYEPGRFVSLVGFEWTFTDGHMNGFDTPTAASRDTQRNMQAYIDFLVHYGGIGVFNHPSYDIQPNWDDFLYRGDGDRQVALLEVGSGPYRHNIRNERAYRRALERGWHVGAVSSQDNHRADWGTAAPTRTGVAARELTREALVDAMRSMRTYATEDANVRVLFESGDMPMGGSVKLIRNPEGSFQPVQFEIYIEDPDRTDVVTKVEVIGNGRTVWEARPGTSGAYREHISLTPTSSYNWFYVRAVQADDDVIVTSPIWVTSESGIAVCDLAIADVVPQAGVDARVTAEVINRNDQPIQGCDLVLYTSGDWGRSAVASTTVDLPGGVGTRVSMAFVPQRSGLYRLELEVTLPGGAADIFQGFKALVQDPGIPRVVVDEGHNNRCSGYMSQFVALLAQNTTKPLISNGRIDTAMLEQVDVLVINMPEQGFALTPTEFDLSEIEAIVRFVKGGGGLLLTGWSAAWDGSRDVGQLNTLLEELGSAVAFMVDDEEIEGYEEPLDVLWLGKKIRVEEARPLQVRPGSDAMVIIDGPDKQYPFAAIHTAGNGRVAVLGAPMFSNYDINRSGYANAEFTLALVKWLSGGEWVTK